MTVQAGRDAHRALSGPASAWDHPAYERWLAGLVEQSRPRPRWGRYAAVASVAGSLVVAWWTGVLALYVGWLVELVR